MADVEESPADLLRRAAAEIVRVEGVAYDGEDAIPDRAVAVARTILGETGEATS